MISLFVCVGFILKPLWVALWFFIFIRWAPVLGINWIDVNRITARWLWENWCLYSRKLAFVFVRECMWKHQRAAAVKWIQIMINQPQQQQQPKPQSVFDYLMYMTWIDASIASHCILLNTSFVYALTARANNTLDWRFAQDWIHFNVIN